ncbi:putative Triacylglycerol lipase [Seiridium cardinale]|uniref:Triacylglycerol lipase n=1 Tax=Seiridium cardinale TaxID=138064 RepID=A0ABR2XBK1_9PEZI
MADLKYDPEFWQIIEPIAGQSLPVFDDPVAMRKAMETTLGQQLKEVPVPAGVVETAYEVGSLDGTAISVRRFVPSALKNVTKPQRAVIFVHGGGLVLGSVELFKPEIMKNAHDYEVQIFGVDYRLAPENPAPAAVEDTYAVIQWLQAHAEELNIDPARIGLWGVSAGGGIAAGATLFARDKGLTHPLARLVLIYPMLDDRSTVEPSNPLTRYLYWADWQNKLGWKAYLGGRERDQRDDVSIYAAPGRAESLEGLPPTYMEVTGFDLFAGECLAFAGKLSKANNSVEFHLYPGLPHFFDGMAPMIRVTKAATENRKRVLTDY